jgi:hypothetical protein
VYVLEDGHAPALRAHGQRQPHLATAPHAHLTAPRSLAHLREKYTLLQS